MLIHGGIRALKRETIKMMDLRSHYMLHEEIKEYVMNEVNDFTEDELKNEYPKGHFIEQLKVLIRINKGVDLCVKFYENTPIGEYINMHGYDSISTYMKLNEKIDSMFTSRSETMDDFYDENANDFTKKDKHQSRKRKRDHETIESSIDDILINRDIPTILFKQFIKDESMYIIPTFLIGSWSSNSSIVSTSESSYELYQNDVDPTIKEMTSINIVNIDKLSDPKDYSVDLATAVPIPKDKQLTIQEVIDVSNIDIYNHSDYYKYKFDNQGKYPIEISPIDELKDIYSTDCPHQARWISEIARIRSSIVLGVNVADTIDQIREQSNIIKSKLKDFDWLSSPFTAILTYCLFPEINNNVNITKFIKQMYYLYDFTNKTKKDCGLPSDIVVVSSELSVRSTRKHFNEQKESYLIDMVRSNIWSSVDEIKSSNEYEEMMCTINENEQKYIDRNEKIAKECKDKMKGKPIYTTIAEQSNHIFHYPGIWFDKNLYRFDKSFDEEDYKYLRKIQSYYNRLNESKKYHRKLDAMVYTLSDVHTDVVNTTAYVNFRMMFSSLNIFSIVGNMKTHLKVSWSNIKLSDVVGRWCLPATSMQETIPEFAIPTISEVVIIRDTEDKMDYSRKSYKHYNVIEYTKKVVSYDKLPTLRNVSRFNCKKPLSIDKLNQYLLLSKISDLTGINDSENHLYVARMDRRTLNPISILDKRRFGYDDRKKYKKDNTFIYGSTKSNIDKYQGINYAEYLKIVSSL